MSDRWNRAAESASAMPVERTGGGVLLADGTIAGLIGAATIALWFLLVDTLRGHPLYSRKADEKMNRVFDIVRRAQSAALAAARPGAPLESIDAAARKIITDAGYGPDYKYFTHRLGHGIGMDGHEWPYLVRGNTLPMAPGMCFSDEPGIYVRGEFGIRLEDDMHITENGAELFTPQSPSVENPF